MAFQDSIEHSPHPPRVVPRGHEHNGLEPMLVAPWRKHLGFTFGSNVGSGDLHAQRPGYAWGSRRVERCRFGIHLENLG
jgi:hypothetical protein